MQTDFAQRPGRIPSLDGLRGLSISAVIVAHTASHFYGHQTLSARLLSPLATYGVNVFFVISGFLITTILMKNKEKRGSVSLGDFYRRRAVRILPVALAYIGVIVALGHPTPRQTLYALTFSTSFFFNQAYIGLQQLWSLSVEEQFYLFWPFAFLLPLRWTKRIAWAVVLAVPMLRVTLRLLGHPGFWHAGPAIADTLMAGCLLALYRDEFTAFVRQRLSHVFAFAGIWMLSIGLQFLYRGGYASSVLWFTVPLLIALGVAAAIERRDLFLNRGPLVWLGLLSYSLYLWQQPFLVFDIGPVTRVWFRLAMIALVAIASYKLIEQPALKLANSRKASTPKPLRCSICGDQQSNPDALAPGLQSFCSVCANKFTAFGGAPSHLAAARDC